jgi:diguanylate cyclase (GGDEF)-like protein
MRTNDVIGRWGGEEFVALVPGSLADAAAAAERVRMAFQRVAVEFDGHEIGATVSIGIACGSPNANIEALIARADAAMYRAKINGRNRIEVANEAVAGKPAHGWDWSVEGALLAGATPQTVAAR